jgi:hypothetical protein
MTYNSAQLQILNALYDLCLENGDGDKEFDDDGLVYHLSGLNEVFVVIDWDGMVTAIHNRVGISANLKTISKLVIDPNW